MQSDKSITAPSDGHGESVTVQRIRPLNGRTSGPARRSTKGQWTAEEDDILRKAVQHFKGKNWKKIAECFKDRTDVQCLHRWQKVLNPDLVKGPWSKEEDEIIIELVNKYGPKKWSTIAQHLSGRIGKQCRERWHNHLNPSINKEAWTQQEELALIRAHQIYGNRWAELTKFLPGRTDNAIKNHWNSSVKKKLDSYLASGLLEQFQGLPLVPLQNQPMPSSSSRVQSRGDDNGLRCGIEAEEISECSQESVVAGGSQSVSGLGNAVLDTIEEFHLTEDSGFQKEESSSPVSCSEQYFTSARDANFSIPELPCEMVSSSNFLQQNFSNTTLTTSGSDYQYNMDELPNVSSSEPGHSSMLPAHFVAPNERDEMVDASFQTSMAFSVPSTMENTNMDSIETDKKLISDDECCQYLSSKATSEPLPSSLFTVNDAATKCSGDINQVDGHILAEHEHEYITSPQDGFIYTNGTASSPCDNGTNNTNGQEQHHVKASPKLVPASVCIAITETVQSFAVDETRNVKTESQGAGPLYYEPPRFPSLDVPFLSCDLIQSGSDIQQEYSPLGIRQLMMSSMGCISPFRLWDSPSRDDSPDAVLKTASKTFTGTPSILKKRNRDLLSPLSDRRLDKKLEIDMTFCLSKEFSKLDVMLDDESEVQRTSPSSNQKSKLGSFFEDKENMDPSIEGPTDCKIPDNDCDSSFSIENTKYGDIKTKPSAGHVEDGSNNLLYFSPEVAFRTHGASASCSQNRKNFCRRILGTLSENSVASDSLSINSCIVVSSPTTGTKNHENHLLVATSLQSSTPSENVVDNTGTGACPENHSIFGETPFKRSFESPSAWKSPWFINSFLPGPRVDTDISIEDIGYFMSPVERSYDALALMKQLSEHTAFTFADALEVLGNETPATLERRRSNNHNMDAGKNGMSNGQLENHSHLASTTECRMLDFSECGTPEKATEKGKSSNSVSLSSPTSHVLKGCR